MGSFIRRHRPAIAATALGAVAVAFAIGVMPYAYTGDPSSMESRDGVLVVRARDYLAFGPEAGSRATGLIFYGAARSPPESYAYLGRACALSGYSVYIPRFPLNLPFLAPRAAARIAAGQPAVGRWVLGGHGTGGAAAVSYLAANPGAAKALLLLAAKPRADASAWPGTVVSVVGSEGEASRAARSGAAAALLPPSTRFIQIDGADAWQFGEIGQEEGDGAASLDGPAQRKAAADEALSLLALVDAEARIGGNEER